MPDRSGARRSIAAILRIPFTLASAGVLLAFALWSDSHASQLTERWRLGFGFAPLQLVHLEWHSMLTSLVFTAGERRFFGSLAMLLLAVGLAEWRLGTRRTVRLFFASHLVVLLAMSLVIVLPAHYAGLAWGSALARRPDVGPSAAYYGCLGAALMTLTRYRRWLVGGILALLLGRLWLSAGELALHPSVVSADLAHLIAFPFGVLAARRGRLVGAAANRGQPALS